MPRLLFITANRIGDAVLSTGALEHARSLVPGAAVTIACGPLPAPLFRATPGLERLHVVQKRKGGAHWFALWKALAGRPYDLAVDLRGSLVTYALSARERVVFRKTAGVRHKTAELADLFGAPQPFAPRLHLDEKAFADAAVAPAAPLVLAPGANWIGKVWPADRFAALARALTEGPLKGAPIVLLGAPDDAPVTRALAGELGGLDLAGKLDLLACAALLERARLFVGNDSGLMHIASAVGAPTLGLFGPSDERVYGPQGPRARAVRGPRSFEEICNFGPVPKTDYSLMTDLDVARVEAAARDLIAGG